MVDARYTNPTGRLVSVRGTHPRTGVDYEAEAFVPDPLPSDLSLASRTYKRLFRVAVGGAVRRRPGACVVGSGRGCGIRVRCVCGVR